MRESNQSIYKPRKSTYPLTWFFFTLQQRLHKFVWQIGIADCN